MLEFSKITHGILTKNMCRYFNCDEKALRKPWKQIALQCSTCEREDVEAVASYLQHLMCHIEMPEPMRFQLQTIAPNLIILLGYNRACPAFGETSLPP